MTAFTVTWSASSVTRRPATFEDRLLVPSGRQRRDRARTSEIAVARRDELHGGDAADAVGDVADAARQVEGDPAGRAVGVHQAEEAVVHRVPIEIDRQEADRPRQVHDRDAARAGTHVGEVLRGVEPDAGRLAAHVDDAQQHGARRVLHVVELEGPVRARGHDGQVEDLPRFLDRPVAVHVHPERREAGHRHRRGARCRRFRASRASSRRGWSGRRRPPRGGGSRARRRGSRSRRRPWGSAARWHGREPAGSSGMASPRPTDSTPTDWTATTARSSGAIATARGVPGTSRTPSGGVVPGGVVSGTAASKVGSAGVPRPKRRRAPPVVSVPLASSARGPATNWPFRSSSPVVRSATPTAPPGTGLSLRIDGCSARARSSTVRPDGVATTPSVPATATSRAPSTRVRPTTRGTNVVNWPLKGWARRAPDCARTLVVTP